MLKAGRTVVALEVKSGRATPGHSGLAAFAEAFRPKRSLLVGGRRDFGGGIPVAPDRGLALIVVLGVSAGVRERAAAWLHSTRTRRRTPTSLHHDGIATMTGMDQNRGD